MGRTVRPITNPINLYDMGQASKRLRFSEKTQYKSIDHLPPFENFTRDEPGQGDQTREKQEISPDGSTDC